MEKNREFQIFCHFSAIGRKTVKAQSLEEAKAIVEAGTAVQFDEIYRITAPCKIDDSLSRRLEEKADSDHHDVDYKSWGSE